MKKIIFFAGIFFCVSAVFAVDLQGALKETAEQFSASLKPKSIVAIIGIYSESPTLSDFMLDELTTHLVKLRKLTVADRANLDAIKKEMRFQLSGEVGNASIQQFGEMSGAETVIQGTLKQVGSSSAYALTIRALNVTTAQVTDIYRENVELSRAETRMLGEATAAKKPKAQYNATSVGFQNLLFGLGSYKNKHYGDGALLTIGHLAGWSCLFAGVGVYVDAVTRKFNTLRSYSGGYYPGGYYPGGYYPGGYYPGVSTINKEPPEAGEWRKKRQITGIALMAAGGIVELAAIIYGFVVPRYYNRSNVLAYGNNSGLKFDLTYTSSGDIAPRISYVLRY